MVEVVSPHTGSKSILDTGLPLDTAVAARVSELAQTVDVRLGSLGETAFEDPVLVLGIFEAAQVDVSHVGSPPISSLQAAIVRLGGDGIQRAIARLLEIRPPHSAWASKQLEQTRHSSALTGKVAYILAETKRLRSTEECRICGALYSVIELLAYMYFGDELRALTAKNRSALWYSLSKGFKCDPLKLLKPYLLRRSLPAPLIEALDPETETKDQGIITTRLVTLSAVEIVDEYRAGKIQRLIEAIEPPPRSTLRLLQLTTPQYRRALEKIGELCQS